MHRHCVIDDRLAEMEPFRSLSVRKLRTVSSLVTRVERPEGALVTKQGRRGAELVIVLDGEVRVWVDDREVATRRSGDFLGEISLLAHCPQTATAVTTGPFVAAVVARPDVWSMLHEVPALGDVLRSVMRERLATT